MYEFSDKEIRKNFKSTEYGKKTNIWLYLFLGIALFFVVLEILLYFLSQNEEFVLDQTLKIYLDGLTAISVVTACYFDGKRDGAIEQFKRK